VVKRGMNYPMPSEDFSKLEESLGEIKEKLQESTVEEILKKGISLGMLMGKSYQKKKMKGSEDEGYEEEEEEGGEEEEEEEDDEEEECGCGMEECGCQGGHEYEEEEDDSEKPNKGDLISMLLGRREQGMFPMKPKESRMVDVDGEKKGGKASPMIVIAIAPKRKKQNRFFS